jgi:hypothetical protein
MILVTVTVLALISSSVLGYLTIKHRNKALDLQAVNKALKEFSDNSARRILTLESDAHAMSAHIRSLTLEASQAKKEVVKEVVKEAVLNGNKPQNLPPAPKANNPRRRRKPAKKQAPVIQETNKVNKTN